jgi:hypothetical protein
MLATASSLDYNQSTCTCILVESLPFPQLAVADIFCSTRLKTSWFLFRPPLSGSIHLPVPLLCKEKESCGSTLSCPIDSCFTTVKHTGLQKPQSVFQHHLIANRTPVSAEQLAPSRQVLKPPR